MAINMVNITGKSDFLRVSRDNNSLMFLVKKSIPNRKNKNEEYKFIGTTKLIKLKNKIEKDQPNQLGAKSLSCLAKSSFIKQTNLFPQPLYAANIISQEKIMNAMSV
jgi:hypothetical protein